MAVLRFDRLYWRRRRRRSHLQVLFYLTHDYQLHDSTDLLYLWVTSIKCYAGCYHGGTWLKFPVGQCDHIGPGGSFQALSAQS